MACARLGCVFSVDPHSADFIGDATFTLLIVNCARMRQTLMLQQQNIVMYWYSLMRIKLMSVAWIWFGKMAFFPYMQRIATIIIVTFRVNSLSLEFSFLLPFFQKFHLNYDLFQLLESRTKYPTRKNVFN